jgi:hypothetical protein
MKKIHRFQMSYSLSEFLILWQIYLNLPEDSPAQSAVLALICALEGSSLIINISSLAGKTLADINPRKHYSPEKQFRLYTEPTTVQGKKAELIFKTAFGAAFLATSPFVGSWTGHFQKLGAFLIGYSFGEGVEKGFHRIHRQMEEAYALEIAAGGEVPSKLAWMRFCSTIASIFRKQAWGMIIVANHPAAYAAVGLCIGSAKSGELRNFERLVKIDPEPTPDPCALRSKQTLNTLLIGGTAIYCIYGMATSPLTDQLALGSFMLGGATGALLDARANKAFNPPANKPVTNVLKFYTEHTDPLAFIYLYLKQSMDLGDTALAQGDPSQHAAAFFAYLSLGTNLGFGSNNDRFPATFDASMGKFLIWKMKGGS